MSPEFFIVIIGLAVVAVIVASVLKPRSPDSKTPASLKEAEEQVRESKDGFVVLQTYSSDQGYRLHNMIELSQFLTDEGIKARYERYPTEWGNELFAIKVDPPQLEEAREKLKSFSR